ncbi:MAG: hypothetical protein D6679_05915 [Candidatus Hydrogenedentota bacterium]|nr:MAG: hypothetical protein D6679_05915 [Candidatus Hydrogenedentota bacterium]
MAEGTGEAKVKRRKARSKAKRDGKIWSADSPVRGKPLGAWASYSQATALFRMLENLRTVSAGRDADVRRARTSPGSFCRQDAGGPREGVLRGCDGFGLFEGGF